MCVNSLAQDFCTDVQQVGKVLPQSIWSDFKRRDGNDPLSRACGACTDAERYYEKFWRDFSECFEPVSREFVTPTGELLAKYTVIPVICREGNQILKPVLVKNPYASVLCTVGDRNSIGYDAYGDRLLLHVPLSQVVPAYKTDGIWIELREADCGRADFQYIPGFFENIHEFTSTVTFSF